MLAGVLWSREEGAVPGTAKAQTWLALEGLKANRTIGQLIEMKEVHYGPSMGKPGRHQRGFGGPGPMGLDRSLAKVNSSQTCSWKR
jgi:hypothetical protein